MGHKDKLRTGAPRSPEAMPLPLAEPNGHSRKVPSRWSHTSPRTAKACLPHQPCLPPFPAGKQVVQGAPATSWGHRSEIAEGGGTQSLE